jgi:hypothetical protein
MADPIDILQIAASRSNAAWERYEATRAMQRGEAAMNAMTEAYLSFNAAEYDREAALQYARDLMEMANVIPDGEASDG